MKQQQPQQDRLSSSNRTIPRQENRRDVASSSHGYKTPPSIRVTPTLRHSQQTQLQLRTTERTLRRQRRQQTSHEKDDVSTDDEETFGYDVAASRSQANSTRDEQSDSDVKAKHNEGSFKDDDEDYSAPSQHRQRRPRRQHRRHRRSPRQLRRIFVALYDYDPATMSPNPDGAQRELAFREGQLLDVFGHKDADGFYNGECSGRFGLIPGNMVAEVSEYDLAQREQNQPSGFSGTTISQQPSTQQKHRESRKKMKPNFSSNMTQQDRRRSSSRHRLMVAMYDYQPSGDQSTAAYDADVIAFRAGDLITPLGQVNNEGFLLARVERSRLEGLVPSRLLRDLSQDD